MLINQFLIGMTTDAQIGRADEQKNYEDDPLLEKIFEEMSSDADARDAELIALYRKCTVEQRALLDDLLICLCGWSFGSIIDMTYPEMKKLNME